MGSTQDPAAENSDENIRTLSQWPPADVIKKRLLRAIAIISAHTHVRTFETLKMILKEFNALQILSWKRVGIAFS